MCHYYTNPNLHNQFVMIEPGVQVTPESVEVKICLATATSLLPSDEEATETQARLLSRFVQVTPESVEV